MSDSGETSEDQEGLLKESFKMDANNKSQNASNPGGPAVLNGNFPHYRNFNAQA